MKDVGIIYEPLAATNKEFRQSQCLYRNFMTALLQFLNLF